MRPFRPVTAFFAVGIVLLCAGMAGVSEAATKTVAFRSERVVSSKTRTVRKKVELIDGNGMPNEVCRSAQVFQFEVQEGIKRIPVNADYCELPAKSLPLEILGVLNRVREIHAKYAAALGRDPAELFGMGVRLSLAEHPLGPLESSTSSNPSTVEIDVFHDFRFDRFPERVYAHELTHWLLIEGRLGEAALTIEGDYLFHESFPDLAASYATGSLVIGFRDPTIHHSALAFRRNGKPLQSMNRPFRDFFLGRFQSEPLSVCEKIPMKSRTPNEREMCRFFQTDKENRAERIGLFAGAKDSPPTPEELAARFKPERCLIHYKNGTAGLNACSMNALGPVLISFIRTIEPLLGEKPLAKVVAAIDEVGENPDHYSCAFTDPRAVAQSASSPVAVSFLSFMRVFKSIRDALPVQDAPVFDAAWAAHGLDTWAKLDHLDRETVIAAFAYQELVREHRDFAAKNKCTSAVPSQRGSHCKAKCEYLPYVP